MFEWRAVCSAACPGKDQLVNHHAITLRLTALFFGLDLQ